MKKEWILDWLLAFAISWLLYDVYYWSMRSSAGVLRDIDMFICLASGILCVLIIIFVIVRNIGKKNEMKK